MHGLAQRLAGRGARRQGHPPRAGRALRAGGFLSVGASEGAPNREFTGQIDDARVWSVARSAAAIRADFQSTLSGTEPGLVGYWTFDEQTGSLVPDRSPNASDLRLDGPNGRLSHEGVGRRSPETPLQVPEYAGAPTVVSATPEAGAAGVPPRAGGRGGASRCAPARCSSTSASRRPPCGG